MGLKGVSFVCIGCTPFRKGESLELAQNRHEVLAADCVRWDMSLWVIGESDLEDPVLLSSLRDCLRAHQMSGLIGRGS